MMSKLRSPAAMRLVLACALALPAFAFAARSLPAQAQGLGPETSLPMPRFVSLRAGEVNVRRGPGLEYRIDWVFQRAGLPVRVVDEYGHWRRITDSDDAGGWVYHALLTSRRMALVTAPEAMFRAEPSETAQPVAQAEQGVVAHLLQCRRDWCRIEAEGRDGWLPKHAIWGVDPEEEFGR